MQGMQEAAGVHSIACTSRRKALVPKTAPSLSPPQGLWWCWERQHKILAGSPCMASPLLNAGQAAAGSCRRAKGRAGLPSGSTDLPRAEIALDHCPSPFSFGFPFFLPSLQPGGAANSCVGREKRDFVTLPCLEWILAVSICSVSFPATWLCQPRGVDPGGQMGVPGLLHAAARARLGQTWRSSTPCSTAGAWQQPPSPLPEGYTKASAARERIMPLW